MEWNGIIVNKRVLLTTFNKILASSSTRTFKIIPAIGSKLALYVE
jgi:hypothetical protein